METTSIPKRAILKYEVVFISGNPSKGYHKGG